MKLKFEIGDLSRLKPENEDSFNMASPIEYFDPLMKWREPVWREIRNVLILTSGNIVEHNGHYVDVMVTLHCGEVKIGQIHDTWLEAID